MILTKMPYTMVPNDVIIRQEKNQITICISACIPLYLLHLLYWKIMQRSGNRVG